MGRPKGSRNANNMDLTGHVYGEFTVLYEVERSPNNSRKWMCRCSCGKEVVVFQSNLRKRPGGRCVDCNRSLYKKGEMWRSMRNVYEGMIGRCYQPTDQARYDYYGGRGITVCDEWLQEGGKGFENFYNDMAPRPEGYSLDRVDFNGNYCKENCRWVDLSVQSFNTRRKSNNTSGRTGVSFNKKLGRWGVYISVNGEFIRLGYFADFNKACEVRTAAELKYYGKVKE